MMRNNGMRIVDQDERGEIAKGSITRQSLSRMKIDLVRALVKALLRFSLGVSMGDNMLGSTKTWQALAPLPGQRPAVEVNQMEQGTQTFYVHPEIFG